MKFFLKNYVKSFGKKCFVEKCVDKLCGRVRWENWVKGLGDKCCTKLCGKSGWQDVGKTIKWINWMTDLVEKI